MRTRTRLFTAAAATAAVAIGLGLAITAPASAVDTQKPWNLAAVAQECARTATADRPGVVEIGSRLVDANSTTTIAVPCVVHLVDGASVALANVTLTTRTLNIHDRATGAAPSVVDIAASRITAVGDDAGILVELNDATDRLNIARTTIVSPGGFLARVSDLRGAADTGGLINIVSSTVSSNAATSGGIRVLASETGGRIAAVETTLDTTGPLTVVAGSCTAVRSGQVLNCSADQVTRGLG